MHLYIGNKLYSSWSMRPWLAMVGRGVQFDETVIPLNAVDFKKRITEVSGAGLVPVLVDGDVMVWETLAIIEYVAERFPDAHIWPQEVAARAHARAISAEMHAGFSALRSACPMNLGKRFARRNRGEAVARDVARACALVGEARANFGEATDEPFLYGAFSAADAMYAPLMTRLDTYDIEVDGATRRYVDALIACDAFQMWLQAALKEDWIVAEDEVDEPAAKNLRPHLVGSHLES